MKISNRGIAMHSNLQMESIVIFVAEGFSFEEMKVLQGVSVLTSVLVWEWQYKDILSDLDDQGLERLIGRLAKVLVRTERMCRHYRVSLVENVR